MVGFAHHVGQNPIYILGSGSFLLGIKQLISRDAVPSSPHSALHGYQTNTDSKISNPPTPESDKHRYPTCVRRCSIRAWVLPNEALLPVVPFLYQ